MNSVARRDREADFDYWVNPSHRRFEKSKLSRLVGKYRYICANEGLSLEVVKSVPALAVRVIWKYA
jgi:hypothetical protein